MWTLMSITLFFILLLTRPASADISIQLGTEADYNPSGVCWKDPKNGCPDAKSTDPDAGWMCKGNIRNPDPTLRECLSAEKFKAKGWRTGVCRSSVSSTSCKDEVANPASTVIERRVMLTFRDAGNVRNVELVGSVVKIFTDKTKGTIFIGIPDDDDYYPVPSVRAADSAGFTRLVPTCRAAFVDVPDGPGALCFAQSPTRAHCLDKPSCKGGGLHKVLIKASSNTGNSTLMATITGELGDAKLKGEWSGGIPDAIKLRMTQARFTWSGNCLYSATCAKGTPRCETPCPDVRIPGAAIGEKGCTQTFSQDTCTYSCEQGPGSSGFSLPIDVVFEVGKQKDSWTERLVQNEQSFAGFADRGDRQFGVKIPKKRAQSVNCQGPLGSLPCLTGGQHHITHADLLAPNGTHFDVLWPQPDDEDFVPGTVLISVPGTTCHDRLSAQYVGDLQAFEPHVVVLEKGEFQLKPPADSFRKWWLGVRTSASLLRRATTASSPVTAAGEIELIREKRFFDVPWTTGVGIAYQILSHGYEPIGYDPRVDTQPNLPLNRLTALGMGSFLWSERFQVYGSTGLWLSWPLTERGYPLAGVTAGAKMEIGLHFAFLRALSAHVGGVMYFPDPVRRITVEPSSSPTFESDWRPSLALKIGIGGWAPL